MASTVLDPVAAALANVITNLALTVTAVGIKWDPGMAGFDKLPAGAVGLPRVFRTDIDQAEDHFGQNDWRLEYPVALHFDLSEALASQVQAAETLEVFIKAVDTDNTLGNVVQEAKIIEAEPIFVDDEARPMIVYRCRVSVLTFV